MDKQDVIRRAHIIPGWLWPLEAGVLFDELRASRSHLEVGTFCGKSLFVTAGSMRRDSYLHWVDPLVSWDGIEASWVAKVLAATIDEIVYTFERPISGDRLGFVEFGKLNKRKFHTIYLDADHHEAETKAAIELALSMLEPDGVLYGHDYWPVDMGVMNAVNASCPGFTVFEGTRIWRYQPCLGNP